MRKPDPRLEPAMQLRPKLRRLLAQVVKKGEPDGVVISRGRVLMRACDVFTPEELEGRIQYHAARVKARKPC